MVHKGVCLVNDLLLQCAVRDDHDIASFLDLLENLSRLFSLLLQVSLNRLLEHKEWHSIILISCVSKRVKGAHETKKRLDLSLGDFPVLPEEEEGKYARDAFSPCSNCELTLLFVIKASTCILIQLQLVD